MTHRHFMAAILFSAFTITGIQASGGFSELDDTAPQTVAQTSTPEIAPPAS